MEPLPGNDTIGYGMQLQPASSRVATEEFECLINLQPVPFGQDTFRLLNDDAALKRVLEMANVDAQPL